MRTVVAFLALAALLLTGCSSAQQLTAVSPSLTTASGTCGCMWKAMCQLRFRYVVALTRGPGTDWRQPT